ncbi:MAG: aldo/keto reductase, partial [Xenococcaceae cyanobacterium]
MSKKTTRRKFLITSAAVAGGVIGNSALTQTQLSSANAAVTKTMPERILGRTGVSLPILGLGGAGQTPLSQEGKEKEAIALVERALKLGIRYYDTAADYGPSEGYLGKILPSYRSQIFLA